MNGTEHHNMRGSPVLCRLIDVRQHEVKALRVVYVERKESHQAEVIDERTHGFIEPACLRAFHFLVCIMHKMHA